MAEKNPHPNTAKIKLSVPIKISGVETDHLTMRRPKLRDRIAASKAAAHQADQLLHLVSSLCEVPVDDLLEIDGGDWSTVEEQVGAFLQPQPRQ
jgi:hypothetical protein